MPDLRPEHTPQGDPCAYCGLSACFHPKDGWSVGKRYEGEQVAALFVEYNGVYFKREDVIPRGVAYGNDQDKTTVIMLDAREYRGPYPVVAHPPCVRWGSFARSFASRGLNRIGDDNNCFASAYDNVRQWGGVIEQPIASIAWKRFRLPVPRSYHTTRKDEYNGFSFVVNQSHYGHLAQKPTWIYVCGYEGDDFEEEFYIPQHTKQVKYGINFEGSGCRKRYPKGKKLILPAHLRKKTPELFADLLVSIAKRCRGTRNRGW